MCITGRPQPPEFTSKAGRVSGASLQLWEQADLGSKAQCLPIPVCGLPLQKSFVPGISQVPALLQGSATDLWSTPLLSYKIPSSCSASSISIGKHT